MWTLALETTSAQGSLALLRDGEVTAMHTLSSRSYSTELFAGLEALLAEASLTLPDMDLFAVADGPGSFTGVRVGLTAVKGFVEVLQKPAVSVSTLRAVALAAGIGRSPVWTVLDASRQEVYFGYYPEGALATGSDRDLEGVESRADFARRMAAQPAPAYTPHAQLLDLLPGLHRVEPHLAGAVGRLGWDAFGRGETRDALQLEARYLRRSDAELHWTRP